jgi:hypothetical protein
VICWIRCCSASGLLAETTSSLESVAEAASGLVITCPVLYEGALARCIRVGSMMTCALDPPIPKQLILTRFRRSLGHERASVGTRIFACSKGRWEFGVLKKIFGGIVACSRLNTALIMLVIPDAPLEWPTFGFTCSKRVPLSARASEHE